MDAPDALLAARDLLRDKGWTTGRFEDSATGAHCLDGALMDVTASSHNYMGAWEVLVREVADRFGRATVKGSVIIANDDCITDLDEACDVLEAAAKRAAEEGS